MIVFISSEKLKKVEETTGEIFERDLRNIRNERAADWTGVDVGIGFFIWLQLSCEKLLHFLKSEQTSQISIQVYLLRLSIMFFFPQIFKRDNNLDRKKTSSIPVPSKMIK